MAAYEGIVAVSGLGRTSVTLDCPDGTVTTIKLDVWEGEGTYLVHRQHRRELSLFDEPTL
ncbi:MAG TPA: hypothetical protein VNT60_01600 [Deinococcales bacterium]|nr:hypothetical protein [Deinococcales bacterium]